MDKMAELVRDSEVRGALAAFVDTGLMKVASADEFDAVCNDVCKVIGASDYNIQKVAQIADAVMQKRAEGVEKTASLEKDAQASKAALGELFLMKTAGQIDNETFVATARELMKTAEVWTPIKEKMHDILMRNQKGPNVQPGYAPAAEPTPAQLKAQAEYEAYRKSGGPNKQYSDPKFHASNVAVENVKPGKAMSKAEVEAAMGGKSAPMMERLTAKERLGNAYAAVKDKAQRKLIAPALAAAQSPTAQKALGYAAKAGKWGGIGAAGGLGMYGAAELANYLRSRNA